MANEKVFKIKIDGITRAYSDVIDLSKAIKKIGNTKVKIDINTNDINENLVKRIESVKKETKNYSEELKSCENDLQELMSKERESCESMEEKETLINTLEYAYKKLNEEERNSTAIGEVIKANIGELKTEFNKLEKELASTESALNKLINKAIEPTKQVIQVFKDASDVIEAFGIETNLSKKAIEGISKALKIINALQTLNNSLLGKKGLLSKEGIALDTIRIIQMKAANKALALQTKSTGAATIAQGIFNAVANANPYVLLAMALISVVGALAIFATSTSDASEKIEKMNELVKESISLKSDYINYLKKSSQQKIEEYQREYDLAVAQGESEEELQKKRKKILNEKLRIAKEIKKQAKDEVDNIDENKKKVEKLTREMSEYLKKYNEALETGKKKIKVNINGEEFKRSVDEIKKDMESVRTGLDITQAKLNIGLNAVAGEEKAENDIKIEDANNTKKKNDESRKAEEQRKAKKEKQLKEETDLIRKAEDLLTDSISSELDKRSAMISDNYDRQIEDYKAKLAKDKSLSKASQNAINDIVKRLENKKTKELEDLNTEYNKKLQNESLETTRSLILAKLNAVEEGSEEELKLKEDMLSLEAEQETYNATISIKNAELRAAKIKEIEAKHQKDLANLRKEKKDSDSGKEIKDLEEKYKKDLSNLTKSLENKEITQKEFDRKMLELEIKSLEDQIAIKKKAGEDITDLEIKLSNKRIKQSKSEKDSKQEDLDELINKISEYAEKIMTNVNALFDVANSILDDQLNEAKEKYEEINKQYDEITKKREESDARLQDLEEKASNARGGRGLVLQQQVDAEMAKNQQLAAQEKQLAKDKEKQEKEITKKEKQKKKVEIAQNISQAIVNTSLAVMKAYAISPLTLGMPWSGIIGAVGALQVGVMAKQLSKLENGGLLKGKRHSEGGMRVEGTNIEVEGGEYVVNRESTNRNLGLIRYINSQRRELQPQDINAFFSKSQQGYEPPFRRMFEQGGQLPPVNNIVNVDNESLIQAIQAIRIEPKVSVTDINTAQDKAVEVSAWSGI